MLYLPYVLFGNGKWNTFNVQATIHSFNRRPTFITWKVCIDINILNSVCLWKQRSFRKSKFLLLKKVLNKSSFYYRWETCSSTCKQAYDWFFIYSQSFSSSLHFKATCSDYSVSELQPDERREMITLLKEVLLLAISIIHMELCSDTIQYSDLLETHGMLRESNLIEAFIVFF